MGIRAAFPRGRPRSHVIYYLEDDPRILDLALYALKTAGIEARGFGCAADFLAAIDEALPDAALLDIMLPDIDGMDVLRMLRDDPATKYLPIMMLTAKGSEIDKVSGLDAGADDYLAKPYGMMELVARVRALLRRAQAPTLMQGALRAGPISLSRDAHTACCADSTLDLTPKEFDLLAMLMENAGRALSRPQLLEGIWGMSFLGESRTVDVHVQTLRQKLEDARAGAGSLIRTVRGVGYKLEEGR